MLINQGKAIEEWVTFQVSSIAKKAKVVNWPEIGQSMWLVHSTEWASEIGDHLANLRGDVGIALIWWFSPEKRKIRCSLRSKKEIDVSEIAVMFGGGHKNASGFYFDQNISQLYRGLEVLDG